MIQPSTTSYVNSPTATSFTIEANESMFALLTTRVYNDIILAPIREWSTNAIDACITAGVTPRFDVHIPTFEEPFFSVRDYGTGLHPDDIIGLFCTFGASTKRLSNDFNGTFGIGRVSALAYTTSFTVDSFYNNELHSYVISIQNGLPVAIHLNSTPSTEPVGLRLSLSVAKEDISAFTSKAQKLYQYFDTKPNLNLNLDRTSPTPLVEGTNWMTAPSLPACFIRMSNILYKVDSSHIETLGCRNILIDIPNGTVNYNPGRETLSYDPTTINYLNIVFEDVVREATTLATQLKLSEEASLDRITSLLTISTHFKEEVYCDGKHTLCKLPYFNDFYLERFACHTDLTIHPDIEVYKQTIGNQKLKKTDIELNYLITLPIVVLDVNTNYSKSLNKIAQKHQKNLLVLKPAKKDDFTTIYEFIKAYNFPVVEYVSSYVTKNDSTPTTKSSSRSSSTVSLSPINTSATTFCCTSPIYCDPEKTYYYIPLIGGSPASPDNEKIEAMRQLAGTLGIKIYGISKKYWSLLPNTPNCIPFEEAIPTIIKEHPLHVSFGYSQMRHLYHMQNNKYVPTVIKKIIQELKVLQNVRLTSIDRVKYLKQYFPLNIKVYRPSIPYGRIIKQYPILKHLGYSSNMVISYCLLLEDILNGALPPNARSLLYT
jgi:hypothetical protein